MAYPTNTIDAGTGSSRVFAHPRDDACSGPRTETQSTRTRTPTPDRKTPTAHRITTWANAPKPKLEYPSGPPAQGRVAPGNLTPGLPQHGA
ncbi:hypothetical protein RW1_062_00210 [Rhodococcus wratislaviensis NBRC 100605]|uniref:Uncharacterized protein n=1 Tax=Rhodococcus wratislaviensis NBRC 100605 TaxID=1219028 RepID=X0QBA9_RHOWR|nr:hypothetical protein RW1_062_00210 [Rhodococcus wratislaviensis NBRC 100605]